jgi:hypothetical protein
MLPLGPRCCNTTPLGGPEPASDDAEGVLASAASGGTRTPQVKTDPPPRALVTEPEAVSEQTSQLALTCVGEPADHARRFLRGCAAGPDPGMPNPRDPVIAAATAAAFTPRYPNAIVAPARAT